MLLVWRCNFGLNTLSGATNRVPEGDIWWSCEETRGRLNEGLNMRLLHVWPQEDLLAGPIFNQSKPGRVRRVLEHRDAATIWLCGLDCGNQRGNFALGSLQLIR